VGLAISYVLSLTGLLNGVVTYFTETEKQMVSVERIDQYISDVPEECQAESVQVLVHLFTAVVHTAVHNLFQPMVKPLRVYINLTEYRFHFHL